VVSGVDDVGDVRVASGWGDVLDGWEEGIFGGLGV
jgi:hypothetical protein